MYLNSKVCLLLKKQKQKQKKTVCLLNLSSGPFTSITTENIKSTKMLLKDLGMKEAKAKKIKETFNTCQ